MTTGISEALLPGYRVDPESGAWVSLPWPDDPDEKAAIVASSLGPALIDWAEWRGVDEHGDPVPGLTNYQTGERWRFTPGQKRFIILWWQVDADGRLVYRRGVKRGAKGTGKDPFGGALADIELCGPVELYDWDDRTGRPIGRRRGMPLVQVTSNSEAQSKDLLRVANALWGREAREFYGLDCGDTRTVVRATGGRFEVNTFAEASSEGDPVTASFINESHHMTTDEGRRAAAVARRNVAKSPTHIQARLLELTNAHTMGRESVAERSMKAWQKQLAPTFKGRRDFLYDSIEAPPDADIMTRSGRLRALGAAYSDAPWAPLERLADEMTDDDLTVADMVRFYLNGLGVAEDSWVDPGLFAMLAADKAYDRGDNLAMFLDCSKSEDATALMACRLSDLHVSTLGCWQRPKGWDRDRYGKWLAPRDEVDVMVRSMFRDRRVAWFGVDPSPARDDDESSYWLPTIDGWHRDFRDKLPVWATPGVKGHSVLFDMRLSVPGGVDRNRLFTLTAGQVEHWIDEEGLGFTHDGDPRLVDHVSNAKRRPNAWGTSLGKVSRDSTEKVDLAVAMVGAIMGARLALNSGKVKLASTGYAPRRIY